VTVLQMLLGPVEVPVPASKPVVATQLAEATAGRHRLKEAPVDLGGYEASGLPAQTMGRGLDEDELFFAAPLAAGWVLGASSAGGVGGEGSRT
jgi:hypothetical protein